MNLTTEQTQAVKNWLAQNASVSDVQKNLSEQFGLSLTYMDVRFLIDDIDAQLQDEPVVEEAKQAEAPTQEPQSENVAPVQEGVQVSLSPIQRPGFMASGDVVFSDGEKTQWFLDQMGRLSLSATSEGYTPSQSDIADFQKKLQELFR